MQRLITTSTVVPMDNENRNFRYLHVETGHWSHSAVYEDLIEQYLKHRKANELSIPDDYEAVIQDQLCRSLPPEWCERTGGQSWVSTRFSFDDFVKGMKAFGRLMLGGFQFVSQTEANRRARICSNCYYNVNIPGCTGCQKLAEFVTGDVAKRSTPYDDKLKACAVCHCSTAAMAHFPLEVLESVSTEEKQALFPLEFCWRARCNYLPNELAVA